MVLKKHIFLFIIFFLFILFFFIKLNEKYIENFKSSKKIILMGDSVFDNKIYVKNENVEEIIKKNKNIDLLFLARDDSLIDHMVIQEIGIHEYFNNKNVYCFISIGGNDLLNKYENNYNLNYKNSKDNELEKIWEKYEKTIMGLNKFKFNIILLDVYFPPTMSIYFDIIKKWNEKIYEFAKKNKFKLLKVSDLLKNNIDFIDKIEPSKIGSKNIAKAVMEF